MRVVLCGYYGMGNGGDEALLASLLQMLPPHVVPVVLSGNPAETTERYGVQAYPRKSLRGIWSAFRGAEGFIWGGGSLMQDATSALNPLYYGGLMLLAQTLGLKTIAWGQGIGPLKRGWTRWLTRLALRRCTGVSVRDRTSAALVTTWRIKASLAPDPVWALTAKPGGEGASLPTPRVAVALRSHPWLTPERLQQFAQSLAEFQRQTHTSMLLVPFQPSKDRAIAATLQPYLTGPSQIVTLSDPQQLKGIFRDVQWAIAMRLHALIMAAAEGCPCFALSYDPKVTYVAADLNIPGWDLAPDAPPEADSGLLPWPDPVTTMTQQLIHHYNSGMSVPAQAIQARVEQALEHRALLERILSWRSARGLS